MQTKEKKIDRRVLRSRRQLSAALLELMHEKSFDDITIKDITDRADMNRATFYLHYGTKEELLYKSLEVRFDQRSVDDGAFEYTTIQGGIRIGL